MNRRTLLRLLALGGVGTATLPAWAGRLAEIGFAQATSPSRGADHPWVPSAFSPHQNETVIVISELIIPQTDTPGAKAARVNEFIDAVIADADAAERDRFLQGLDWIDRRSRELHATDFVSAAPDEQTAILTSISVASPGAPAAGTEFFKAIKALTITGYYTSQVGMREELGDDGRMGFPDYAGCTHPEHKVSA